MLAARLESQRPRREHSAKRAAVALPGDPGFGIIGFRGCRVLGVQGFRDYRVQGVGFWGCRVLGVDQWLSRVTFNLLGLI